MGELIALLVILALVVLCGAGYYLTFPALGLITAIVAATWGVVYYRAPYHKEWNGGWDAKEPKSEILFRGYFIGGILAIVWVVAFFSDWSGTRGFFDALVDFFVRKGA